VTDDAEIRWCKKCSIKYVQENECTWSGDKKIDDFIKREQQKSRTPIEFFEWIPYENFKDIEQIGKGGFATIYSAIWKNSLKVYNETNNSCDRYEDMAALKRLHGVKEFTDEFLNEVINCPIGSFDKGLLRCYGISQDPETEEYIMVLELMCGGNLHEWLNNNQNKHKWADKLFLLHYIIKGLYNIHEKGLIHRDFHSGNLLVREYSSRFACISDLGLSGPVNDEDRIDNGIYGVMSYLPPEVLNHKPYTQAADIYGLGMIMYLIATSCQPFHGVAHDHLLSVDICHGVRPEFNREEIPNFYLEMMESCWDQVPSKRITSKELYELSSAWWLDNKGIKENLKDEVIDQLKGI
ncbi:8936_t:CDS:2, partial [Funneliformis geosporum]